MCGITGLLLPRQAVREDERLLGEMTGRLSHRGPDGSGFWKDLPAGVVLGHRRLSIIDLSEAGAQPMESPSGRWIIAFNGEVYNFGELRMELERAGVRFRGHSDTEVMLAAIEQWGLEPAIRRFVGMFAFALWDRQERRLFLVRDRLGVKPLFYCFLRGGGIAFASELKALEVHPGCNRRIRRDVLPSYLRYSYIPDPLTIRQDVFRLMPGSIVSIDSSEPRLETGWSSDGGGGLSGPLEGRVYWDPREVALRGIASPAAASDDAALEGLEEVLGKAVADRLVADVPLGAFLSGGVDSSAVVALMREHASGTVKSFSIGFSEAQFNEAHHAREVARHLETDHTELIVTPAEAMEVIPGLAGMYDEPYADYSNIPTFLVSRLARQSVTVSLSGDGGDELFGGYNRHILLPRLWKQLSRYPLPLRRFAAALLLVPSPGVWDALGGVLGARGSGRTGSAGRTGGSGGKGAGRSRTGKGARGLPGDLGYKLHKLAEALPAGTAAQLYHALVSQWKDPMALLAAPAGVPSGKGGDVSAAAGFPGALPGMAEDPAWEQFPSLSEASMFLDQTRYLPDDILTKMDRASMAVSLEARVPILDHRVVEYAWSLPLEVKIRDGVGKMPLRNLLYKRVPRELIERPKQGFTVPVGLWLRGPLKEWAEDLLEPSRLAREGFFSASMVERIWKEHQSGRRNHDSRLWPLLMFQAWLEKESSGL
jgi:asparagine synthase (glutamine-hydrolysing)